jgi:hypothetical protein
VLDELNVTTLKEIMPTVAQDNYFLGAPFLMALRAKQRFQPFNGGTEMQTNFLFRGLPTQAYGQGQEFTAVKRQILASISHVPKFYVGLITEFLEDLEVFNTGPNAVLSIIENDLAALFMSLTSRIAVEIQKHGQNRGAGVLDRSLSINGIPEALNDGVAPGPDGLVYTTYGGQLRSEVGSALNSTPIYLGKADGSTGKLDFLRLMQGYTECCIGNAEPDMFSCTKAIWSHMYNLMEAKQRVEMVRDPYYGVTGVIKFMNMSIMKDDLALSARYGQNNADYGDFRTSTFTMPAGTQAASYSDTPPTASSATVTPGEVAYMLNTDTWDIRIKNSRLFGGGFTGFMPSPTNTRVIGRTHLAINLRCRAPRLNKLYYGHGA